MLVGFNRHKKCFIAFIFTLSSLCSAVAVASPNMINKADCVVLLHGLAGTPFSMKRIQRHLQREGFQVVNLGYPSREHKIATLSELAIGPALDACGRAQSAHADAVSPRKVHFVTHSMGGIVLRQYLSEYNIPTLGHVVMLAPPNKGNELAARANKSKLARKLIGPALAELAEGRDNVPESLNAVEFSLGVIAGTRSHNPLTNKIVRGKDDGTVSVEATKVQGMRDHVTVPASHMSILFKSRVLKQISAFLSAGQFVDVDST